jgi:hypothetical protein
VCSAWSCSGSGLHGSIESSTFNLRRTHLQLGSGHLGDGVIAKVELIGTSVNKSIKMGRGSHTPAR